MIRLSKNFIVNYANPAAQMLLALFEKAINQKAPPAITDMPIAALADDFE
jgi:hypothetical protein